MGVKKKYRIKSPYCKTLFASTWYRFDSQAPDERYFFFQLKMKKYIYFIILGMVYFFLSRSKIKAYACGISKRHEMHQKTVTIRRNYMCAYLFLKL